MVLEKYLKSTIKTGVSDLDQGIVRFGINNLKSDRKKRFYIFHYSSTQVRDTSKQFEVKMKGIK